MAKVRLQHRRGTAAQWAAANPVLAVGEMGFETDTGRLKVGNGSTNYISLDWTATVVGRSEIDTVNSSVSTVTGLFNQTVTLEAAARTSATSASASSASSLTSRTISVASMESAQTYSQVSTAKAVEANISATNAAISAADAQAAVGVADGTKLWISSTLPTGISDGDFWVNNQVVV